ncbi:hypothetical protein GTY49_08735, partial [Streptomyces sp. SID5477]|nr:hypothetical protein [Streptomyces sp. SID5477]
MACVEVLAGAGACGHSWRTNVQRRTRPTRTPGGLPPMSRVEQPSRRTL